MLYNGNNLRDCTRQEYASFIRALNHDQSRPIEGNNICAMQWVNPDNLVIAQAIYEFGSARYQIKAITKFADTSCSQCGKSFGPGDNGFSHCSDHTTK